MPASRPTTAPDFLLSRADGSVRTQGALDTFNQPEAAITALREGSAQMIVGALPFDREAPAALSVPKVVIREPGPLEPPAYYRFGPGSQLRAHICGFDPEPEEHLRRVEAAISTIQASRLRKVVLARAVDITFEQPVDPRLVAARLIDLSANRDGFIADLSPAGRPGAMLVGSSPEVLIKRRGSTVTAFPLAGSAPRQSGADDERTAHALAASEKNLDEHRLVVEHLQAILQPLCSELHVPGPQLMKTNEMWHLATPITGTLAKPWSALELALMVHPTPAICGTPTAAAEAVIATAESERGFYAGAVGWCDHTGDGEYMVAIRCAEVAGDGLSARTWAGGGILADSDPGEELAETSAKLRTILRSLGLD